MDKSDIDGDNEVIFDGKFIRTSLWLAKKIKDMDIDCQPIMLEIDNVAIALNLEQFEELFNGVSKMKSAIEKRRSFE